MNTEDLKYIESRASQYESSSVQAVSCADVRQLLAERAELLEALTRICANPAVQDLIENNPRTSYLIRDARAAIQKAGADADKQTCPLCNGSGIHPQSMTGNGECTRCQ